MPKDKMDICIFAKAKEAEIVEVTETEIEVKKGAGAETKLKNMKKTILSIVVLIASTWSRREYNHFNRIGGWIVSMVLMINEYDSTIYKRNENRNKSFMTIKKLYNLISKNKKLSRQEIPNSTAVFSCWKSWMLSPC